MIKHKLSIIGNFHTNHNEDAGLIVEIEENKILIAVMDGCSMGIESHFASTLIAKLLRKIGKEISFLAFIEKTKKSNIEVLETVLQQLFIELREVKNQLHLTTEELLSTLILGIVDIKKQSASLITIGDGMICYDGNLVEYEHDNRPDYLAYHLQEDFTNWLLKQEQKLNLNQIQDLSIATDGIFTFLNFDGKTYPPITPIELIDKLLIDQSRRNHQQMFKKQLLIIEDQYGLKPSDDLTIIRLIFESNCN